MYPTPDELRATLAKSAFGGKLIGNMYRGLVVEAIIAHTLGTEWDWCAADWAGWDFKHKQSGIKLEVKQTAVTQTWEPPNSKPRKPTFGIPSGKGYWEGAVWTKHVGRRVDLYVFAYHGERDREIADHLDVSQWRFAVLAASALPATQTISMDRLKSLADKLQPQSDKKEVFALISELRAEVAKALASVNL